MTIDEKTEQRERFDKRVAFNDFFKKLHDASVDEKTAYKRLALCETEHGYGSDEAWVAFQAWEKAKDTLEVLEKQMLNYRWSK